MLLQDFRSQKMSGEKGLFRTENPGKSGILRKS